MNIFDGDGNIYWTSQYGVNEDCYRIISDWTTLPKSIIVFSRSYMTLVNGYPDYLLATSLKQEGIVIICRSISNYIFLVLSPSGHDPTTLLDEIWKLSRLF